MRKRGLNTVARQRGQNLARMALAWTLRDVRVTSALIGASSAAQIKKNVAALGNMAFTPEELAEIDRYASDSGIDLWSASSSIECRLPQTPSPSTFTPWRQAKAALSQCRRTPTFVCTRRVAGPPKRRAGSRLP